MARLAKTNLKKELRLTNLAIAATLVASALYGLELFGLIDNTISQGEVLVVIEQVVFVGIILFFLYGNLLYQFMRRGYIKRKEDHNPESQYSLESIYDLNFESTPSLTFLVPSYKESEHVVRMTLLSAALQAYPRRRIVLLIDDPPQSTNPLDRQNLERMRRMPESIQMMLAQPHSYFNSALSSYLKRKKNGSLDVGDELRCLSGLYDEAALWFERQAVQTKMSDHAEAFFATHILCEPALVHREHAQNLFHLAADGTNKLSVPLITREYRKLASMFRVDIASFERKRYRNLSHEPNKAMNLNSYLSLIGKKWREVSNIDGLSLKKTSDDHYTFKVPVTDYIITLDADSILLSDYALRLISFMEQPKNARVAVAQTPYSAFPEADRAIERAAGATTDLQYIIHQGFTRYQATYWVGANALLRYAALKDIAIFGEEDGYRITKYIQDRTVIEDTESSVDLIDRGWDLYNYPARLAYSATPQDFGSLLIQRRRWANGGLIILPKLIRYLLRKPIRLNMLSQGAVRFHYLTSIAAVNIGILLIMLYPFPNELLSIWLILTAIPYFMLYGRDLMFNGYKASDVLRVYSLNLMLIPINLGGVFKSIKQALTGKKTPFGRTPKVINRTAAPAYYIVAEFFLFFSFAISSTISLFSERWPYAFFGYANAIFFLYALAKFVGFSESKEDLLLKFNLDRKNLRAFARVAIDKQLTLIRNPQPKKLKYSADESVKHHRP